MAIALSASALILGTASDRLRRRGVSLSTTFAIATSLALLAQLALVLRWPIPTWLPWIAIAGIGAGTVLSYAIVAELFPKSASGRASGALNLLHIGCAFVVQLGTGFVLDLGPIEAGRHPPVAYQTAFGINLTLQVASFLWFVRPKRRAVFAKSLSAHPIHAIASTLGVSTAVALPYLQARQDWRSRQAIAQRQKSAWRSAALVSVMITVAIGALLLIPVSIATLPAHAQFKSNDRPITATQILIPRAVVPGIQPKAPLRRNASRLSCQGRPGRLLKRRSQHV
ncbi:MAG: MFS transporter [Hyphomicrobiaceae bacterium]